MVSQAALTDTRDVDAAHALGVGNPAGGAAVRAGLRGHEHPAVRLSQLVAAPALLRKTKATIRVENPSELAD